MNTQSSNSNQQHQNNSSPLSHYFSITVVRVKVNNIIIIVIIIIIIAIVTFINSAHAERRKPYSCQIKEPTATRRPLAAALKGTEKSVEEPDWSTLLT